MATELYPHITADVNLCGGRPVIAGTSIAISILVAQVAAGASLATVAAANGVTEDDVRAALEFAAKLTDKPAEAFNSRAIHSSVGPYVGPAANAENEELHLAREEATRLGIDPNTLSPLGRRLFAQRVRIREAGIPAMTWDELDAEMAEQRGGDGE